MMTRDSIETAYAFLHQKRNVYIHSLLDWQKDDIEYAIATYVDGMSLELYEAIADGRADFLRDHLRFEADITQAVERLEMMLIDIREATKEQAPAIARLIMMAMTDECCLHFCGVGYGLDDFWKMMTSLVSREDTQYSYKNACVAVADDEVVGVAVSYDGGRLRELRQAFIEAAKAQIGKDHTGMADETQAGELYLDSLAVKPAYRRQGIAKRLLRATKERADLLGLPCVGLLVDKGNPAGEALYASVGFRYANDSQWGGHPMKHLVW